MKNKLKSVLASIERLIEQRLNRHKSLLGPGQEFVATITIRQGKIVRVVPKIDPANLNAADWEEILSRAWGPRFRRVLEMLRDSANKPTTPDEFNRGLAEASLDEFHGGDRDHLNGVLSRAGLPYRMRSLDRNVRGRLQMHRRM